jgi:hypothetical protein
MNYSSPAGGRNNLLALVANDTQRKALLAIAFAGAMLSSPPVAFCEGKAESSDSVMRRIEMSTEISREFRAYYLLRLASTYLEYHNSARAEAEFRLVGTDAIKTRSTWNIEKIVTAWTDEIAYREALTRKSPVAKIKVASANISDKDSMLADAAIKKALLQLDRAPVTLTELDLYFIASKLFQKSGNKDGIRECDGILEKFLQDSAKSSPINQDHIRAASSILNSMADCYVYVTVSDASPIVGPWATPSDVVKPTEQDFIKSENLKLRATALLDRLDSNNHLRWRVHRDLALWYLQIGKMKLAENEKQILFELVGVRDDSILYPQARACGQVSWWEKPPQGGVRSLGCGMG